MRYEGVIFDLDGTLVNTLEDIADSMNRVLAGCRFPTHDLACYRYFVGKGIKNLVIEALPETYRQEEIITNCFEAMIKDYRGHCLEKSRLYAGIEELLSQLEERHMKLAVLSNKADDLAKMMVRELLSNWSFEETVGARPDMPRKPDPTGALFISKSLGICPEKFIYVGDTGIDMNTAHQAGMFPVGVLWGFRTKEELLANGAKMLLNHPLDLMELLIKD